MEVRFALIVRTCKHVLYVGNALGVMVLREGSGNEVGVCSKVHLCVCGVVRIFRCAYMHTVDCVLCCLGTCKSTAGCICIFISFFFLINVDSTSLGARKPVHKYPQGKSHVRVHINIAFPAYTDDRIRLEVHGHPSALAVALAYLFHFVYLTKVIVISLVGRKPVHKCGQVIRHVRVHVYSTFPVYKNDRRRV